MKTIIAGLRDCYDYRALLTLVGRADFPITEVVSGRANGVDKIGEKWARENSVPVKEFPADWAMFGKLAGPIRNRQMADYAEALLAIWDGKSKGTGNMIQEAQKRRLKVLIYRIDLE